MQDFISEVDLHSFEGWLRYQGIDASSTSKEELANWQQIFEEAKKRTANTPQVGLMKLQPVPGESRYAVALQDDSGLWLVLWARRSRKGEFFVMLPRGDREWDPHTSYHLDGTLHIKSYGSKVIERTNQPLTGPFGGSEDLGQYAGFGPKGVGAVCDPAAFTGVVKVKPGVLGPRNGAIKVDLIEPGKKPLEYPELRIVDRQDFCDKAPWVVIRIGTME